MFVAKPPGCNPKCFVSVLKISRPHHAAACCGEPEAVIDMTLQHLSGGCFDVRLPSPWTWNRKEAYLTVRRI